MANDQGSDQIKTATYKAFMAIKVTHQDANLSASETEVSQFGHLGPGEGTTPSINLHLEVQVSKAHVSHLALVFCVSYKDALNREQEENMKIFYNYWTLDDVEELESCLKCRAVGFDDRCAVRKIQSLFHLGDQRVPTDLFHITIRPRAAAVKHAENLFTNKEYPGLFAPVKALRRVLNSADPIHVLVLDRDLKPHITSLITAIRKQRQEPLLRKWFVEPLEDQDAENGAEVLPKLRPEILQDKHERPKTLFDKLPLKSTFFNKEDVLAIHAVGWLYELEFCKRAKKPVDGRVTMFRVTNENEYLWGFIILKGQNDFNLHVGEKYRIAIPVRDGQNKEVFRKEARICYSYPLGDSSKLCFEMDFKSQKWDEHAQGRTSLSRADANVWNEWIMTSPVVQPLDKLVDAASATKGHNWISVGVTAVEDWATLERPLDGLLEFYNSTSDRIERLILGNDPSSLPPVDVYGELDIAADEKEEFIVAFDNEPSEERSRMLKALRSLAGGQLVLQGPSGSGKSKAMSVALQPLLHCPRSVVSSTESKQNKILVICPQHLPLDRILQTIKKDATEAPQSAKRRKRSPVLVRLFNPETNLQTVWQCIPQNGKSQPLSLGDSYGGASGPGRWKFKDVKDKNVRELDHTVGMWVMRLIGLVPDHHIAQPECWTELREAFLSYKAEKSLQEFRDAFKERVQGAINQVLKWADAVFVTVIQALTTNLPIAYPATLIVGDEMSKLTTADHISLTMHYRQAKAFILVGDSHQLRITLGVPARVNFNPMRANIKYSAHERLRKAGFDTVYFNTQYRCTPDISKFLSEVFYAGQVLPHPINTERESAKKFRGFVKGAFGIDSNAVLIDVPGTVIDLSEKKSKSNLSTLGVTIQTIEMLLDLFKPSEILTVTPYSYQQQRLLHAFERLALRRNISKSAFECCTADAVPGLEKNIQFFDTVTDGPPGFLSEFSRTLVACSRGENGLIIVADVDKIMCWHPRNLLAFDFWPDEQVRWPLKEIIRYFRRAGLVYKWKNRATLDGSDIVI